MNRRREGAYAHFLSLQLGQPGHSLHSLHSAPRSKRRGPYGGCSVIVPLLFSLLLPWHRSTPSPHPSSASPAVSFRSVKQNPPKISALTVSIKDRKWRFYITKVEKLSGRDPSGIRLLQSIFPPPHLRLTGPDHLLSRLQDPQVEEKPLTLEGRLYVGERMFFVTIVNPLPQE